MNFISDMRDAMFKYGLPYSGEIRSYTGIYHQFASENGECKKSCCRYRIFENQLGAHFICWRRDINVIWFIKSTKLFSSVEVKILARERERVHKNQQESYEKATKRCVRFLLKVVKYTNKSKQHPYVLRKKIFPYMAWGWRKLLIIPVYNINFVIQSIQFIYPNGFKHGKTKAPLSEGMIWLSHKLPCDYDGIIRVCEGWATGCTIREIMSCPVICAINCHNLIKVVIALAKKYPLALIKICADNDSLRKDNPGLTNARKAALCIGAPITYPITDDPNVTDFNDLFIKYGGEEAYRQLSLTRE